MFFKRGHAASKLSQMKKQLGDYKDMKHLGAATKVFLNEVFGDPMMTYSISEFYQHAISKQKMEIQFKNYKAAPVSDA